jgi:hypothetical protein
MIDSGCRSVNLAAHNGDADMTAEERIKKNFAEIREMLEIHGEYFSAGLLQATVNDLFDLLEVSRRANRKPTTETFAQDVAEYEAQLAKG